MIHLASSSPQRQSLLKSLGVDFQVVPPRYEEEEQLHELPAQAVERHSRGKAFSVLQDIGEDGRHSPVLGVDTMIVFGGMKMGKAGSEEEAFELLRRMAGQQHLVYSGITLVWPGLGPGSREEQTSHSVTAVRFSPLADRELEAYVATGEWRGRAGAYAIQGRASAFVREIEGDYTNIVGLPVPLLVEMLREKGEWPPSGWRRE